MFDKILIANRGEIALRVIRACRELGIKTVAVYSEADKNALHVRYADEAYLIGPALSTESYLSIDKIIRAAEQSKADAIHPGYGFLSENHEFSAACEKNGITFIGPKAEAIKKLGSKLNARKLMNELWVPVVPGWNKNIKSSDEAVKIAGDIGYPVILKASAGGGGRGMRVVNNEAELRKLFDIARAESQVAFGSDEIYMERYLHKPRHIEFQILADEQGNAVHLGERECSLQRKHQKVLEEAPSIVMTEEKRKIIGEVAADAALSSGYTNAGTMEFIMDEQGHFYFLEVNSRIQVEHGVTEMVTGVDLVKEQIRIAAGEKLSFEQSGIRFRGHAIECRINAEDPFNNFCPCPGKIIEFYPPLAPWVRTDTCVYSGYTVPQYYDSLIAKIIAWGSDRDEAIARMINALNECVLIGVKSTIPYHRIILKDEEFRKGAINTKFIEEHISTKEVYKCLESEEMKRGHTLEERADIAVLASAVAHYLRTKDAKSTMKSAAHAKSTTQAHKE